MHGQAGDVDAAELNRTRIGADEPHGHVEGGCFARTVGAKKTHDFARTHMDRNTIDHSTARVSLG